MFLLPDVDCILHSETETDQLLTTIGNNIEEMIMKNIEDNTAGTHLSDSLEDVINMLNAFQHDMTSLEATEEDSTNHTIMMELSNTKEETTTKATDESLPTEIDNFEEVTTAITEISDSEDETTTKDSEGETTTEMSKVTEETTTDNSEEDLSPLGQTLSSLKTANLTKTDEKILIALLELEELRGEQKEKKIEIKEKLNELETLLNQEELNERQSAGDTLLGNNTDLAIRVNKLLNKEKFEDQKPRKGKTISSDF